MRKLLVKAGRLLCACSVVISPLVVEGCKTRYYQPKEPDGLEEFAKKVDNNLNLGGYAYEEV